jgi:outer membrane protein assembly factor BamA
VGLRYHTPIGPIRVDFSYTLNPPIYPVIITYGTQGNGQPIPPYVGNAGHFNFFFSIGQAF